VDGLPLDGMQEVRSSNLLSSTGQRHNSKTRAASTAGKYRNGNRLSCRTPARAGIFPGWYCWAGPGIPGHGWNLQAAELGECLARRFFGSSRAVTRGCAGQAVPAVTLGAVAGVQRGPSSGRPGCGVWLLRTWRHARRCLAPAGLSLQRGPGAICAGRGGHSVGVRFLCAAARAGAERARCASITRRPARPAPWCRRRQAADGSPSDRLWRPGRHGGTMAVLTAGGLRDLILATVGQ
jgi:hypothetical protein